MTLMIAGVVDATTTEEIVAEVAPEVGVTTVTAAADAPTIAIAAVEVGAMTAVTATVNAAVMTEALVKLLEGNEMLCF